MPQQSLTICILFFSHLSFEFFPNMIEPLESCKMTHYSKDYKHPAKNAHAENSGGKQSCKNSGRNYQNQPVCTP
jgi:hypothetical protein